MSSKQAEGGRGREREITCCIADVAAAMAAASWKARWTRAGQASVDADDSMWDQASWALSEMGAAVCVTLQAVVAAVAELE